MVYLKIKCTINSISLKIMCQIHVRISMKMWWLTKDKDVPILVTE
jgi:hypothetical protein